VNRQLILVRHSVPEIRESLHVREWLLSEEGGPRAEHLAERLIPYHLDLLFTSPEPKAMETAEFLAARLQLPVHVLDDLHEHQRKSVRHLSKHEFETAVCSFFETPEALVLGNETANQAYARFSEAIHSILSENEESKIAVVSHGTVISLFVSRLTGQPGFGIWSGLGLPCFIVLDMQSKDLIAVENIS
jgi:2,3-bisphosphoglycerate-dependent phosphoglycerate mutase